MKLHVFVLIFGAALAVFCGLQFDARRGLDTGNHLERVLRNVETEYVDGEVDINKLYYDGLNDMLRRLDRNSRFITPAEVERFDGETEGYFVGIGVVLSAHKDDYPSIQEVITGGPAEKQGVLKDDRIVRAGGEDMRGTDLAALKKRIQGPKGTRVDLRLQRGNEFFDKSVPRARVDVSSIGGLRLYPASGDASIGYIRLNQFQRGTAAETQQACDQLIEQGARSLVLDLRQNVGGVLVEGVQVARLFSTPGVLLRTRGRDEDRTYEADYPGRFSEYNLVILIDGGSASASEFVCAALQDRRPCVVVGDESYGKWTVQSVISIGSDTRDGILKLTTSSFHRPDQSRVYRDDSGKRRIQPDVTVPADEATTRQLFGEWQSEQIENINTPLVVVRHERPTFDAPESGDPEEPRAVDAALIRALSILEQPELYQKHIQKGPQDPPGKDSEAGTNRSDSAEHSAAQDSE